MDITSLLELRQTVRVYYTRYERYITYALRFLTALICVGLINSRMGFRAALSSFVVTFLVSLICAVLPTGFTALFCALLILVHLYTFSIESCMVAMVLFLAYYLIYYHFSPRDSIVLLLTPALFAFNMAAVMPFVVGLLFAPVSVISMSFGVITWFFLHYIVGTSAGTSSTDLEAIAEESMNRLQGLMDALVNDKTMMIYIIAMGVSAIGVYIIRRLPIKNAWYIAIGVGAFIQVLVLLIGSVAFDATVSIVWALLGTVLGIAVSFVIMFFVFNLDYAHVENVQFEDDDYYYFVKAVPKYSMAEKKPSSKLVNRSLKTDTALQHEKTVQPPAHAAAGIRQQEKPGRKEPIKTKERIKNA